MTIKSSMLKTFCFIFFLFYNTMKEGIQIKSILTISNKDTCCFSSCLPLLRHEMMRDRERSEINKNYTYMFHMKGNLMVIIITWPLWQPSWC